MSKFGSKFSSAREIWNILESLRDMCILHVCVYLYIYLFSLFFFWEEVQIKMYEDNLLLFGVFYPIDSM